MTLLNLAERVKAAGGADREIDLAIYLLLNPDGDVAKMMARGTKGLDGSSRFAWELRESAFLFEQRNERGDCTYNGGIPIPRYTASLDAAMSLVPEGWVESYWRRHDGTAVAECHAGGILGIGPLATRAEAATPALALTAACLRAIAAGEA